MATRQLAAESTVYRSRDRILAEFRTCHGRNGKRVAGRLEIGERGSTHGANLLLKITRLVRSDSFPFRGLSSKVAGYLSRNDAPIDSGELIKPTPGSSPREIHLFHRRRSAYSSFDRFEAVSVSEYHKNLPNSIHHPRFIDARYRLPYSRDWIPAWINRNNRASRR